MHCRPAVRHSQVPAIGRRHGDALGWSVADDRRGIAARSSWPMADRTVGCRSGSRRRWLGLCGMSSRRRPDVVLCGDAVVHAVLFPVLRLLRVPHATMVMGLDVTYDSGALSAPPSCGCCAGRPVSSRSARRPPTAAAAHGVPRDRLIVVRLGVAVPDVDDVARARSRAAVLARWSLPPDARPPPHARPARPSQGGRMVRRRGAAGPARPRPLPGRRHGAGRPGDRRRRRGPWGGGSHASARRGHRHRTGGSAAAAPTCSSRPTCGCPGTWRGSGW